MPSRTRGVASRWGVWALAAALACAHGPSDEPSETAGGPAALPSDELAVADGARQTCGGAGEMPMALRWPARGAVTSGFGSRNGRQHDGIDISGYHGAIVRAAADGTVVFSGRKRTYGRVVILEHGGGLETVYAHNTDNFVVAGSRVRQGQGIADMGSTGRSTGPHLHFEVRLAHRPLDPLACLPERATTRR